MERFDAPSVNAELLRLDLSKRLDPKRRSALGQFLTPPSSAKLLASFFQNFKDQVRLLDPGAGAGALTAATVDRIVRAKPRPSKVTLVCFEVEPLFRKGLRSILNECVEHLSLAGITASFELHERDFLETATAELRGGDLFGTPAGTYTHAILNPPYGKIHSRSAERRMLQAANLDTGNLYSAFVWLALQLLEPGGELAAITPRSFCNGPYFKSFRKALLGSSALQRIHVYEKRNAAFSEDDVLQENILFHVVRKSAPPDEVLISTSSGMDEEEEPELRQVPYKNVVQPVDPEQFIRIPSGSTAEVYATEVEGLDHTLDSLGLSVSTGPVVDFRLRDFLRGALHPGDAPLIYPAACSKDGFVHWPPLTSKKPIAIDINPKTAPWLVPVGTYVLVKRFSAKEERRRVVATVFDSSDPQNQGAQFLGLENHLNYYHENGRGLSKKLAVGLAAYLNSSVFDAYFRVFSGHTQVNSMDLRQVMYPSRAKLERFGLEITNAFPDQEGLDQLAFKALELSPEVMAALNSDQKITEALTVLGSINAGREQKNERSALCLLCLGDLTPAKAWSDATAPMLGIAEMMGWFREHYGKDYAPNTRETVRRQTMHQFVQMGLVLENPDSPQRPTNSPHWCYQLTDSSLGLIKSFGSDDWPNRLAIYVRSVKNVLQQVERNMSKIPVQLPNGRSIDLSSGGQNILIKAIVEEFCPRFTPGGSVLYLGDAAEKFVVNEEAAFKKLGLNLDPHGKFPDVVVYHDRKDWLVLVEAVTSHGPVDLKRHNELKKLFTASKKGLVYVTAFPTRKEMVPYLSQISWETEVWVAEAPEHLIHFDGERFFGPYKN